MQWGLSCDPKEGQPFSTSSLCFQEKQKLLDKSLGVGEKDPGRGNRKAPTPSRPRMRRPMLPSPHCPATTGGAPPTRPTNSLTRMSPSTNTSVGLCPRSPWCFEGEVMTSIQPWIPRGCGSHMSHLINIVHFPSGWWWAEPRALWHSWSFICMGPAPAPASTCVPTGPPPPSLGAWLSFLFPEAFFPYPNPHPDLALLPSFLGFLGLVGGRQTEATNI